MNWIMQKAFEWKVVPKLLAPLIRLYSLATHKRTEILIGLWLVLYILESYGIIEKGLADKIETMIGGGATLSFLDKIKRYGGPALDRAKQDAEKQKSS